MSGPLPPELVGQRVALLHDADPRAVHRCRTEALRLGLPVRCQPGDRVRLERGDARVLAVTEAVAGPDLLRLERQGEVEEVATSARVIAPHRPPMLLGEAELGRRLEEDLAHPEDPRCHESLEEAARRALPAGLDASLRLLAGLDGPPSPGLRRALTAQLRSVPSGQVELALRRVDLDERGRARATLPALAASADDPRVAADVLERLERLPPAEALRAVEVCGRWLVGAGGPAFAGAELRERVAALARQHPDHEVRVALFVQAARALQSDDLLEAALASETPHVAPAAAQELLRRGQSARVWGYLEGVEEVPVLLEALEAAEPTPAVAPAALLERWLSRAGKRQDAGHARLRERALLRVAELEDAGQGLALLEPWLSGKRADGLGAALWSAGLLGRAAAGEEVLARVWRGTSLPEQALGLEALARLGHELASPALDAWGLPLLACGPWGEEAVDLAALLLGRGPDPRELLGRFVQDRPQGPVRRARALDVAAALKARGEVGLAVRTARDLQPVRWPRFRELLA